MFTCVPPKTPGHYALQDNSEASLFTCVPPKAPGHYALQDNSEAFVARAALSRRHRARVHAVDDRANGDK